MARESILDRRVQLNHASSEEEDFESQNDIDESRSEGQDEDSAGSDAESNPSQSENEGTKSSFADISFGALAKAQESIGPRKRKMTKAHDDETPSDEERVDTTWNRDDISSKKIKASREGRSSKHAPAVLSSKHEVSRKRAIFEPSPTTKFRDPRFDPTITSANHGRNAVDKANQNYSFLTAYQADEVLSLKSQMKKSKDPKAIENLKRQIMSIESKLRSAEARQKEREILQRHTEKEKQAIKSGQKSKPYYLKASEVKKMVNTERLDAMGKRARDKALERRRKREKGKDARDMPRERRQR